MRETAIEEEQRRHYTGYGVQRLNLRTVAFLLGVLVTVVVTASLSWPPAITAVDVERTRINVALPPLTAGEPFIQTFRPEHDGLVEVELMVARLAAGTAGTVTLHLEDEEGNLVAAQTWPADRLEHNQPLSLRFSPQPASAGRRYSLYLSGDENPPFSFWGYEQDVHAGGALLATSSTAQELRFVTRYQLLVLPALRVLLATLANNAALLLLALALMLMPGALLLSAASRRLASNDSATRWGVALALGVAMWPLLWYWLSLPGIRWHRRSLALVLVAGWALVLWLRRHSLSGLRSDGGWKQSFVSHSPQLLLLLLLAASLSVRLLAVRDLAFPLWVDPIRHALITQVMVEQGRMLQDYAPFLAVDYFPYHAGFHTLAAGLALLGIDNLPRLLLILGQLLNALIPLTLYAATWLVTRRHTAALLAAFLVALPFYFPAYYVSWGRLTQLTGVLLLPVLLAFTWLAAEGRQPRQSWWLVGLLAAGLALIHIRVFLIYLPFVPIAWLVAGKGRFVRPLVAAALLGLVLAGPRLWELSRIATGALTSAGADYNDFPFSYLSSGWEKGFLVAGVAAVFMAVVPALRGQRWSLFTLALAAWSGSLFLALSYVPSIWLINLNSAYITLFVPLALILGTTGAALMTAWRSVRYAEWIGYPLLAGLLTFLLLGGARQQIDILNPTTHLARPADLAGIRWVEENVPADALIAVNGWHWLGATWAGSDGGGWLLPLTGRQTTIPPADYIYSRELATEVAAFNQAAQAIGDWSDPASAQWLAEQGVTHVFVGARGGFFEPAALANNPALDMLYAHDGVFVFALNSAASP